MPFALPSLSGLIESAHDSPASELAPQMKHILLVDDDPLVLRIYQQALALRGFRVDIASDGLEAIKSLKSARPDLLVLDLMMPRLSGAEVLKQMQRDPALANLPVVVLSNAYMDPAARDAAAFGARKGLLKATCTPRLLAAVIEEVLSGKPAGEDESHLLAVPPSQAPLPNRNRPAADRTPVSRSDLPAFPVQGDSTFDTPQESFAGKSPYSARWDFLNNSAATCSTLVELYTLFIKAATEREAGLRLRDLYRKVHFVAAMAAIVECHQIAHMAAALEAVLFGLMNKHSLLSPSLRRTTGQVIGFFEELFNHAREWPALPARTAQALVVDDDPLSNRLSVMALRNAQVQAQSTTRPAEALLLFEHNHYDLVLLDIEMEGMNGFEISARLRSMPGYLRTPVIFVTAHTNFDVRVKTIEAGGDDLIAKPILPVELAAKAVLHLLRTQMLTIPVPDSESSEPMPPQLSGPEAERPHVGQPLEETSDSRVESERVRENAKESHPPVD